MKSSERLAAQRESRRRLWWRGELSWKLKPCQKAMLKAILGNKRFKYIIKCARRLGKSYLLCLLALMVCIKTPGAQVKYAAPTAKAVRKIIRPLFKKILRDCPDDLRPQFVSADGMYRFPNGSEIHLAGVNNGHADDLRGTATDLFIIDEARDIDELHYLVHDVAMPQFLDPDGAVVRGRRLIVASSPAKSPAHEFTLMAAEAEAEGNYSKYDIFAGGYPLDVIRLFLEEDGVSAEDMDALLSGKYVEIQSATVRREYLAEDVIDEEIAIVSEWKPYMVYERESTEFDQFYHHYLWMDIGIQKDFTVVLFALYDFKNAHAYIEHELIIKGVTVTTDLIAQSIADKTKEFPKYKKPWRRIADNSHPLLINDLIVDHQLAFVATDKDRLHEMVNALKIAVKNGELGAHPRCVNTIGALKSGIWNKDRTKFAHSAVYGHYDAVAACVYGIRNLDTTTNPIPVNYGLDPMKYFLGGPKKQNLSPTAKTLRDAFKRPKR